jgi:branched-chain amino acid transport system ATP-binding protein
MLHLKNIVVRYGGVHALKGVSMEIPEGSITCLIGANGAGKSTTLRAISGMVPLTKGEIHFEGRRIDGMEPQEIVELGIGHVPEGKKLFLEMSVRDNLLSGAYLRKRKHRIDADLKRICGFFPVLERAINRPASNMSGGEQQMLAIGRGLMSAPKLLLLDEPSLGLSPLLTREVGRIIRKIADEGVSVLLIEQNASLALSLAKKCYVLETGTITVEGTSAELQDNDHIRAAYLGLDPAQAPATDKSNSGQPTQKDSPPAIAGDPSVRQEINPLLPRILETEAKGNDKSSPSDEQPIFGSRLDNIRLNIRNPSTSEEGVRERHLSQYKSVPSSAQHLSSSQNATVSHRQPVRNHRSTTRVVKKVFRPPNAIDQ